MKQKFLDLYTKLNEEKLSNITGGYWARWSDEGQNRSIGVISIISPIGTGKH